MSGRKRRLLKWIVAAQSRFRQRGTSLRRIQVNGAALMVWTPRRHRCAKVVVLSNDHRGGVHGPG